MLPGRARCRVVWPLSGVVPSLVARSGFPFPRARFLLTLNGLTAPEPSARKKRAPPGPASRGRSSWRSEGHVEIGGVSVDPIDPLQDENAGSLRGRDQCV